LYAITVAPLSAAWRDAARVTIHHHPVMILNSGMRRRVTRLVPRRLRPFFLNAYYFTVDGIRRMRGHRDAMTPPTRLLRFSTDPTSDFQATGKAFADFLVARCGLRPDARVLDVGCGVGRVAVALTDYLDERGGYEGFDVVPSEIAWCQAHVTTRRRHFTFQLADVYNGTYNPKGRTRAAEYRFPFADASFDLVIVASVFTHLLSQETNRYATEMARVLKPGGRCFASFYLLNDDTRRNIDAETSVFEFASAIDGCLVQDPDNPELAVAHDEDRIRELFGRCGLAIDQVLRGTWSLKREQIQDILLATRLE
jgi:SAM-dependent methyltransferase